MKHSRREELFRTYFHYWIVKLNLHKKYKFVLRKDNRIDCKAYVCQTEKPNVFEVVYNTRKLTAEYKIIRVALHEIGHLLFDYRTGNSTSHETEAEFFALSTMREFYPKFYKRAFNWVLTESNRSDLDKMHKNGYREALKRLNIQ